MAEAEVDEALENAEKVILEAIKNKDYEAAAEIAFKRLFQPIYETLEMNSKQIAKNSEQIDKLTEKINKNSEQIDKLTKNVNRLVGETGWLRGLVVEQKVYWMLAGWFNWMAPEYELIQWDGLGGDVVIRKNKFLAAVDIAVTPKIEDIVQLKNGMGAIKDLLGKKPDLLIVYSRSGIIPEEVLRYAERQGVKLVRGPRELKEVLDKGVGQSPI